MHDPMTASTLTIELFGMARHLTGERALRLEVPPGATLREVTAALAQQYPQLVGRVIAASGDQLIAPNVYNLDGRTVLHDLDRQVVPGEPLCLMFIAAGG